MMRRSGLLGRVFVVTINPLTAKKVKLKKEFQD